MVDGPRGWGAPLHTLVLSHLTPGEAVLDLGCGAGEFARAAVARGAVLTGVDSDPSAVAAASALVPEARFLVGDAHDPPPGPFDVAVAVQLLAHVANPVVLLRAAARVAPLLVVTVWGREEECDVRAFGEALAPWLGPRRSPPGPPPLADPARLRQVLGLADLPVTALEEVVCPFDYSDDDAVLEPLFASGIGRHAVNRAGPAAVREAVLARLAEYRLAGGGYRLANLFRVAVARSR